MEDLDERIGACIDAFVTELTALVRELTFERAVAALEADGRVAPQQAARNGRGKRPKRTAQEIEAQCDQIMKYLSDHPGERAEAMASRLGTSAKGVTFALKKLLATQQITRKGRKRATQYYPA